MSLNTSLAEARVEAVLLQTQMHQKGCTCKSSKYQEILDRLCQVLAYIQREIGKTVGQASETASTLVSHKLARPRPSLTMRPFLRAKIIKSYVDLSVILWYPTLQVSFVLFTLLYSGFLSGIPSPKHSQCIKPLQYLCWPCFLASFLLACC